MPGFYAASNAAKIAEYGSHMTIIEADLSRIEDEWLSYQEELEKHAQ